MKKYLICLGLLGGLYATVATAEDAVFSDAFVVHLESCTPFADMHSEYVRELKTQTTSTILGKRINGDCEVEIETLAENNMHVTQRCLFDAENLEQVVNTLRRMRQKPSVQGLAEGIAQSTDEHAIALSTLLMTSCDTHRDEMDNTADIRKNLEICEPLTQTEKQEWIEFVRRIVGMKDGKCLYELEQWRPSVGLKTTYNCALDVDGLFELTEAMSKMIMPAYSSSDVADDALDSYNPSAELEFVKKKCTQKIERIKVKQ